MEDKKNGALREHESLSGGFRLSFGLPNCTLRRGMRVNMGMSRPGHISASAGLSQLITCGHFSLILG